MMGIHQAEEEWAATQQETIAKENSCLDKFSPHARHRCTADKRREHEKHPRTQRENRRPKSRAERKPTRAEKIPSDGPGTHESKSATAPQKIWPGLSGPADRIRRPRGKTLQTNHIGKRQVHVMLEQKTWALEKSAAKTRLGPVATETVHLH
jgi:hypothetical protein